jgi:PAS domain S-box-containing protein
MARDSQKTPRQTLHPNCGLEAESTAFILESISDGVFTVDGDWCITTFNRAAEEITGIPREEALGRHCWEVFRASMCEADCALRSTMEHGDPIINRSAYIINARGRRIPISVSTALLKDARGMLRGGVETFRDLSVEEELRKELKGRCQLGDMLSRSEAMGRILDILPQVAESNSTVLIQGETGTGKELLARAIHNLSPRKSGPFVAVNCSALPDTLLESEMFGYQAGAFTGAHKDKPGRFALAQGGTLFLDEIGDISPALQVRLLRVLQEKTVEPLGGTESLAVDVRVVTATNQDLSARVKEKAFRQDLFYRVNVVRLELPPLRRRREDVALLAEHFISRQNRLQGKSISGLSPKAFALLMAHDFPGNVRELENIIEHAFVLCPSGEITPAHLPVELIGSPKSSSPFPALGDIETAVRTVEAQTILNALERNNYNRLATARELGIHKSTLFRKLKALNIQAPKGLQHRR